jgi:hypothetical protein
MPDTLWDALYDMGDIMQGRGAGERFQAQMAKQLSRQRHREQMEEMEQMYSLRGTEAERGHELTMEEMGARLEGDKIRDELERNRMLLGHNYSLKNIEAQEGSGMKMEEQRHGHTLVEQQQRYEHSKAMEMLQFQHAKDPDALNALKMEQLVKSRQIAESLDAREITLKNGLLAADGVLNWTEKSADRKPTPFEITDAQKTFRDSQRELAHITQTRQILHKQVKEFNKTGYTDKGIVPLDRQSWLDNMVTNLQGRVKQDFGMGLEKMKPTDVIPILQNMMQEDIGESLTQADIIYLIANIGDLNQKLSETWGNVRAIFKSPKKKK